MKGSCGDVKREKSCGAVVERDGMILVIRHIAGHWSLPKGHVEDGETEIMTAKREILEETGLEVEIDAGFRFVNSYSPAPGVMKDVVYFVGHPTGGRERPQPEEVKYLGWYSLTEALHRLSFLNDKRLVAAAADYIHGKRGALADEKN